MTPENCKRHAYRMGRELSKKIHRACGDDVQATASAHLNIVGIMMADYIHFCRVFDSEHPEAGMGDQVIEGFRAHLEGAASIPIEDILKAKEGPKAANNNTIQIGRG